MKKLILIVLALILFTGLAMAETNYICIKLDSQKYVVHPTTSIQLQQAIENNETDVYFYTTNMDISEYASAGVFGTHETLDAAKAAILAVDPLAHGVVIDRHTD